MKIAVHVPTYRPLTRCGAEELAAHLNTVAPSGGVGNVDDLIAAGSHSFDAAWLDYTGPLSIERMRAIRRFWSTSVRQVLVVTALKARWNRETSDAIGRAGSHGAWMRKQLPGDVLHDIEYQDGASPMAQIALRRPA